MSAIAEEWPGAEFAVLTGEELLVYAGMAGLGVPAGLDTMDFEGISREALEQRFAEAARALVSRGVVPSPHGEVGRSALGALLRVLCNPDTVIAVSRITEDGQADRQYAMGEGKIVGHAWDDQSFHLVADLSRHTIDVLVRRSAGVDIQSTPPPTSGEVVESFSFSESALADAIREGQAAVAAFLSDRLASAGLETGRGPALAAAMAAGRNCSAGFRSGPPDFLKVAYTGWLDAGPDGLWSVGVGGEPGTVTLNLMTSGDLAGALSEARRRVMEAAPPT
jgi:hypothetical protein